MNPLKKLAGQTVIYGMGSMLPRLINYAFMTPLYTEVLSQYGTYTVLYAYVAYAMILLPFGMETSFFRFANTHGKERTFSTAFTSVAVVCAFFLTFTWIFAPDLAIKMNLGDHPNYIYIFTAFVAIDALASIPFAVMRQEGKALKFASLRLLNVVLLVGLNFAFLVGLPLLTKQLPNSGFTRFVDGVDQLSWVLIANFIASAVILACLTPLFFRIKWKWDKQMFKPMIKYAWPLILVGTAAWINDNYDKILLRDYTDEFTTGLYGANYKVAILMVLFVQMFRYAAEPFFFNEAKKKNAHKTYADTMKYFVLIGWIFFLGVNLYIDIVKYFISDRFWSGLNAVPVVMGANLCLGIYYNLSIWYKLTNKTHYGAIISGIGAVTTFGLLHVLVPRIGYMGAAYTTLICFFTMMLISYFWGKTVYPVKYPLGKLFWYSGLALVIYIVSLQIPYENIFLKLVVNTGFILLFVLLSMPKELVFLYGKLKEYVKHGKFY